MPKTRPRVYFVDGLAIERDYFAVVAYLHEFEHETTEYSRIYLYDNEDWSHFDLHSQVVSLARVLIKGVPTYFYLGRRGEVTVKDKNGQTDEQIVGPGTGEGRLGYVNQVAGIGGHVFACGANRQVYKRGARGWTPMHADILVSPPTEVAASFRSLDGTSDTNLYAVGKRGEIFQFTGKRWFQRDSPSSVPLHRVVCASKDLVYVCGAKGTLLRGAGDEWEVLTNDETEEDLWGMTIYGDELYVAYDTGILRLDGDELVPVKTPTKPEPEFSRLSAVEDVLYTFGGHDILRYDGKRWRRFVCPDNA
jgi:hypothetical protein